VYLLDGLFDADPEAIVEITMRTMTAGREPHRRCIDQLQVRTRESKAKKTIELADLGERPRGFQTKRCTSGQFGAIGFMTFRDLLCEVQRIAKREKCSE
jgi:hypothetical protein